MVNNNLKSIQTYLDKKIYELKNNNFVVTVDFINECYKKVNSLNKQKF